jgi:hypothetical protein
VADRKNQPVRGSDGSKTGRIGDDVAVGRLKGAELKAVTKDATDVIRALKWECN